MNKLNVSHNRECLAVLVALASGPLDRARIPEAVLADTVGEIVFSKSSFYRHLNNLLTAQLITGTDVLRLTEQGWRVLQNELKRIEYQRLILKTRLHITG